MIELKRFFDEERKRLFVPHPFLTGRIIARWNEYQTQEAGIWESIPTFARSVLALALVLVLCFIVLLVIIPQVPDRGMIEALLEPEQSEAEGVLYSEDEVPAGEDFFELIALEEQ